VAIVAIAVVWDLAGLAQKMTVFQSPNLQFTIV
jgi:hypothetical protein